MKPYLNFAPALESGVGQTGLMWWKLYQSEDRHYVIQVKDKLRLALTKASGALSYFIVLVSLMRTAYLLKKRVGKVTKDNTVYELTHLLLDEREDFFKHHSNPGRDPFLKSGWDMLLVLTTDPYYEWLLRRLLWRLINKFQAGEFPELQDPPPVLRNCWKE